MKARVRVPHLLTFVFLASSIPSEAQPVPLGMPVAEVRTDGQAPELVLRRGEIIGDALERWARAEGWSIEQPDLSWVSPSETRFEGGFQKAITELVTLMVRQGAAVQLHLWPQSKSALIIRTTP